MARFAGKALRALAGNFWLGQRDGGRVVARSSANDAFLGRQAHDVRGECLGKITR